MALAAAVALVGAASLDAQQIGSGQEVRRLEPGCADCRIGLERVAVLGTDSGPPGIGPNFDLGRSETTGRYWYSSNASGGEILVFEPDGSFLRTVGGSGEGPGEFVLINEIIPAGPDAHVIDLVNLRWTVLSGDFTTLATQRLTRRPFASALADDSSLVVSEQPTSQQATGPPLHVFRLGRGLVRSFGEELPASAREDAIVRLRHVAAARDGGVWTAAATRYRLERWDLQGTREAVFERDVEWFLPHDDGMHADPEEPPAPWFVAMREGDDGLLWTAVLVADEEWYEGLEERGDGTYRWAADRTDFLDTVIEVIDPATGTVLATRRWDVALAELTDHAHVAVYRESEIGVPRVEIWRLTLQVPP